MKVLGRLLVVALLVCGTAVMTGCGDTAKTDGGAATSGDTGGSDDGSDAKE